MVSTQKLASAYSFLIKIQSSSSPIVSKEAVIQHMSSLINHIESNEDLKSYKDQRGNDRE
ncbi:hypothetical protein F9U64_19085 [Gracilibacillus oryzae]|uniref:Uncharacterized protein n=1 Tax=Gracilibacillus oryzae TaxID=1672701 RepID=A0A7C8KRV6_9BACI|nr:hypothetical protein [Gracilibacillus oryzae]KAB8126924.1 hypothetical protein F9U64_19085 [Gracilibacillus oryzae]